MGNRSVIFNGQIDIICGPMFAGKTEELLKRLNRLRYAKIDFLTFKPKLDTRTDQSLLSRDGRTIATTELEKSTDIFEHLKQNPKISVIAIDEVQFFDDDIVEVVRILAKKNYYIILSGLDKDFRGEPFGCIAKLLSIADKVIKLTAICVKCGRPAAYSQRLINNKPASYKDPIILIGDTESYEARCYDHFQYEKEHKSQIEILADELLNDELLEGK